MIFEYIAAVNTTVHVQSCTQSQCDDDATSYRMLRDLKFVYSDIRHRAHWLKPYKYTPSRRQNVA